jgi:hypothetical protein
MITYSLYVKTHRVTGLKYLGQTSKSDPHKYTGSGKYWLRHIKQHGKNWDTEILLESQNKKDIDKLGAHYSDLWNVVESNDWANLKPETGDGAASGIYNPMKNPVILAKQQAIINDPIIKIKHRTATINAMNTSAVKRKLKAIRNTTAYKEQLKTTLNKPRNRNGSKNSNFDCIIYNFEHVNGLTFTGTRFEFNNTYQLTSGSVSRLLNGEYKTTQGWNLANLVVNTDSRVYNQL